MTPVQDDNAIRAATFAGASSGVLTLAGLYCVGIARSPLGFEYPLDDVYIHLAMAEQIWAGGYGVNSGEYASAASSPIYPLLLAPFAGSDIQRWIPLIWNVLAIAFAGGLFGAILARAQSKRWVAVAFAITAPFALNMYVTAYTGMENMAHGAAALMIVLGLWVWVEERRLTWMLFAGVALAPLFRLEGLAMAISASAVVAFSGNRIGGAMLVAFAALPVALFAAFLVSLGLDPLPNSIVAKLSEGSASDHSLVERVVSRFQTNSATRGGLLLFVCTVALLTASFWVRAMFPRRALFGGALVVAGLAHLAFGSIGWMDRYENYAILAVSAALILVLREVGELTKSLVMAVVFAGGISVYLPPAANAYSWNVAAIRLQQGEMARFAKDFAEVPVAVNDLGYVSWRNPSYVLDLWGLASSEALRTRLSDPPSGWGGPLASKHSIELVMIYDRWLGDAVSPNWIPLGVLHLNIPRSFIGGYEVSFLATSEEAARRLRVQLAEWEVDLPEMTSFEWAPSP